ncbi:MAG TPA: hypothetical protein VGK03_03265 [Geothrix sp.]
MRTILRAILAVALLLGGWGGDWALAGSRAAQPHDCCCGAMPSGPEDPCPCPKPESNRTPQRGACTERQVVATQAARRAEHGARRTEPRPEPVGWARTEADAPEAIAISISTGGRDPDLGRHLARLSAFRI